MGRKKIDIKLIDRDSIRNATFEKRKIGVLKKAMELSILCDCEVSVTINRRREELDLLVYASDPYDQIIDNYHAYRGEYRLYANEHIESLVPGKVSSRSVGYVLNKTAHTISNTRTVRVGDAMLPLDMAQGSMYQQRSPNLMMPVPGFNMMPIPMMVQQSTPFMSMYNLNHLMAPTGGVMPMNPTMMMNRMPMHPMHNPAASKLRMLLPSPVATKQCGTKRSSHEISEDEKAPSMVMVLEESTENVPPVIPQDEDQKDEPPTKKMKIDHSHDVKSNSELRQSEMKVVIGSEQ